MMATVPYNTAWSDCDDTLGLHHWSQQQQKQPQVHDKSHVNRFEFTRGGGTREVGVQPPVVVMPPPSSPLVLHPGCSAGTLPVTYLKLSFRRGHLAPLKCTKTFQRPGLHSDPAGRAYNAPPDPLTGGEGAGCPLSRTPTRSRPFRCWPLPSSVCEDREFFTIQTLRVEISVSI